MPRKRVLLDARLPHRLRHHLAVHDVETAHHAGLDRLSDSQLLNAAEGHHDVLVTMDRNLAFQQRLSGRRIAVVVVRVANQSPGSFETLVPALEAAISCIAPGEIRCVGEEPD